jgi:hypothetical protein
LHSSSDRFFSRSIQPFFISCINGFSTSGYLAIAVSSPPALSRKTPRRNAQTSVRSFLSTFSFICRKLFAKKSFYADASAGWYKLR